jgi:histidinol-phosphate aminotransferase
MSYFRPTIDALAGYVPGEQPQQGGYIKLNTNENPYPPSPVVLEALQRAITDRLRLYPDPLARSFRRAAAEVLGVGEDWIVATNGSDDALTILTRACLAEQDLLVAPSPSYPMYRVLAQIQGCRFASRPFTAGWGLPPDFLAGARLGYVPNPNSPTGTMLPPASLLELARAAAGVLVVDEAYADFADDNCLDSVHLCERLVVTRSLSKSYSLAGIRFGFVVAQPVITQTLLKVKDPYNCDALAIVAATAAIRDREYFQTCVQRVRATRSRLEAMLRELGFAVTPSHANFVWVQHNQPVRGIYEALKERKILVRYFDFPGFGTGLRISVGTDDEIEQLGQALRAIV